MRVEFDGLLYNGRAANTDVVAGSAQAYLEALNRAVASKKRKDLQKAETVVDRSAV
jgi:hypothetical protein